jgi:hypothetical protein
VQLGKGSAVKAVIPLRRRVAAALNLKPLRRLGVRLDAGKTLDHIDERALVDVTDARWLATEIGAQARKKRLTR